MHWIVFSWISNDLHCIYMSFKHMRAKCISGSPMHCLKVPYLKAPSTRSFIWRATFALIVQNDSLPVSQARLGSQRPHGKRKSFGRVSFQSKRSYLLHVSVVHGVVRHFVRLQLDNLLELIAVAFPLAHYDHFVKQEYVPEETRAHVMHALSKRRTTSFLSPWLRILTDPVWFGWRWSTPWAPRQSSASHTPPVWPAA